VTLAPQRGLEFRQISHFPRSGYSNARSTTLIGFDPLIFVSNARICNSVPGAAIN
jgi:hypothetical protein